MIIQVGPMCVSNQQSNPAYWQGFYVSPFLGHKSQCQNLNARTKKLFDFHPKPFSQTL